MTEPNSERPEDLLTLIVTWVAAPVGVLYALAAGLAFVAANTTMAVSGNGTGTNPMAAPAFLAGLFRSADADTAWTSSTGRTLGPVWIFWLLLGAMALLVLVGLWYVATKHVLPRIQRSRPGRGASWATARQERRIGVPDASLDRPCRLVAGRGQQSRRLLAAEDCISAVVFGPNGSGKSTGLIAPNVLEWAGPLVMTTTKVQDVAVIHSRRLALGPVWVIAPAGCAGFTESGWSPVAYAIDDEAADRMAEWLCEASGLAADVRGRAWVVQARKLIKPLLLAANCSGGGIDDFVRWVYDGAAASEEVRAILRGGGYEDAAREYASTWTLHQEGVGSVLFTAYGIADVYSRPTVRASVDQSTFDVSSLLTGSPATLIIVAPESDADRYAPMLTALIAAVVHAAETEAGRRAGPLEPRLLLALDEAGNVFRFPRLANLLTTARGNGIQLLLVYHDLAQLQQVAGPQNARTVMSNAKLRVLLPGVGDLDTLKYFSEMFGRASVERASTTRGAGGQVSRSVGEQAEDLAPLHVLQQLPRGEAVIQYENLPPMRVRLRFWFRDKQLQRLAGPAVKSVAR